MNPKHNTKHYENAENATLDCDGVGHEHHHHDNGSCCCDIHAKEFHGIQKPLLIRLIIAALCYLVAIIFPIGEYIVFFSLLTCAILAGYDVIVSAIKNLLNGHYFDECFLISFVAIAAFIIGEYEEGAAVFLLYQVGSFCQLYAINHSRQTIYNMTGEYNINEEDVLISNRFILRFSKIYTPIILLCAVCIAIILPITSSNTFHDSIYKSLSFLVLSCPCAIVISVPMAYFAGISAAAKNDIFIKNTDILDDLANNKITMSELNPIILNQKKVYSIQNTALIINQISNFVLAKKIATKTKNISKENIFFTLVIKFTVLLLSILGVSSLWFAVFADSGVTVIVVLNALRTFRTKGIY